jgi:hypothetical protein
LETFEFSLEALRRDPGLLKLELYCRGARLDDSCFVEEDGGRKILRTRAGLGSGLEVVLPGGLWTNVPVSEEFAHRSPYVVRRRAGRYRLERELQEVAPLTLSPRPEWYDLSTTKGRPMTRVGTLQGTYLGIYQAKVCEYWTQKPAKVNCKFCSVGLNLGVDDADDKSIDEPRGPRWEPWVTNGEIIAGLEPPESSMRAIEWITSVGAIPTVCVFRPLVGTDLEDAPPPRAAELVPVFERLYDCCMARGLPIGCAPNIHVSLVLLPEECAGFSRRRFPVRELRRRAVRAVASRVIRRRLSRHDSARAAAVTATAGPFS